MKANLSKSFNVNFERDKSREGEYSFICLDSKWDALQRKGLCNPIELNTLELMHCDFYSKANLTDLILR